MADQYKYQGFISYSHADERKVEWLHRSLERFRLPRRLARELKFDNRRLLPFFRDRDELASSSNLTDSLVRSLQASRNLIVVCSPAAAKSEWVNREILEFQKLKHGERIFCVLAGGDPDDPDTCFPPALRNSTPLAVDLRDSQPDRKSEVLRLVAGMLDVGFDTLKRRHRQSARRRLVSGLAATAATVGLVTLVTYRVATEPPCQGSAERLAGIWNESVQQRTGDAFLATGLPYAEDTWSRVVQHLTNYSNNWIGAQTEACEATLVHQEQSEQLMDLRMSCLDERRFAMQSLIETYSNPSDTVVERAVDAAIELPSLSRCSDRPQLLAAYALPDDKDARENIAVIRSMTVEARTQLVIGQVTEALNLAQDAVQRSGGVNFPPAEAAALLVRGEAELSNGAADSAKATFYEAAAKAVLARENELIARAWLALPRLLADYGDETQEAIKLASVVESYVVQLPDDHPLRAEYDNINGYVLLKAGQMESGIESLRRAVEHARINNSADLPEYLNQLAWGLSMLHKLDEAGGIAAESLALAELNFGQNHPQYAEALSEVSRIERLSGNHEKALELQTDVVTILTAAYPDHSPQVVSAMERQGWMYNRTGLFDDGIRTLKRALEIEKSFEAPNHSRLGSINNGIGDIYLGLEQYDEAQVFLEQALEAWQAQGTSTAVGIGLNNLGNLANRRGDHEAAENYCRRALENDEAILDTTHPNLAYPLDCIGEALLGQERPDGAVLVLSRAHELVSQPNIDEGFRSWTKWLFGRALTESGDDVERGMNYVHDARTVFAELGDAAKSELSDIEAWLQARRAM